MSKIPGSAHLNISLGGLTIVGGAVGFWRKASKISLVAGLTFGALFLGSGYLIANDREYEGHVLATGTAGFMAFGMGQRYFSTRKFMPSGLVAAIAVAATGYNMAKARDWSPSGTGA